MATILFVGAGRHQLAAILRARDLGYRVVAIDRNPDAPGLAAADAGVAVDFTDVGSVAEAARLHEVHGVLTVASDRAVPVVAAVAGELSLPSIGAETARRMTDKGAMRAALELAGLPQPRFAIVRTSEEALRALDGLGLPAVLKPVDASGQRGIARIDGPEDVERSLPYALTAASSGEAILEAWCDGAEVNCMVVVRDSVADVLTISDRIRPAGAGFGVALAHAYPSSLPASQLEEAKQLAARAPLALGLRDGIAYPQLLASPEGAVRIVELAARIPGGQMGEVVRLGTGVDLVQVALLQAIGEEVPDAVARPRFEQPLAVRFFTAEPGPLRVGRVSGVGPLEAVRAAEGVVQADAWIEPGETIRPARVDGDRRGYVIALGSSRDDALRRADAAAALLDVEVDAGAAAA